MKVSDIQNIVIVGAGPAGLYLSAFLTKHKIEHKLLEQAPRNKNLGFGILIQDSIFECLDQIDISKKEVSVAKIKKLRALNNRGRRIIDVKLKGKPYYAMERGDLIKILRSKVVKSNIMTNKRVLSVFDLQDYYLVKCLDGTLIKTRSIIGADGIKSSVRNSLFHKRATWVVYSALYFWIKNRSKQTLEVINDSGINNLVLPVNDKHSILSIVTTDRLDPINKKPEQLCRELLNSRGQDCQDLLTDIYFKKNSLVTLVRRTKPFRFTKKYAVLIGDAAHGETPILGWGTTMAIEDAYVLGRQIITNVDLKMAFLSYYQIRRKRTNTLHAITTFEESTMGLMEGKKNRLREIFLFLLRPFDNVLYNSGRTLYRKLYNFDLG